MRVEYGQMKGSDIMKGRIKEVRKTLKLTQSEFGTRIGVASNTITSYETGTREPSNSVITSICREFNVNRTWLETGEGEMFDELSTRELAARIVGQALSTSDEFVINTFIALGQMSPDEWRAIKSFVDKIKGSE